jgi:hypothetical protein
VCIFSIIDSQPLSQLSGRCSDDVIILRIVVRIAIEDGNADGPFLQLIGLTPQRFAHNIIEKRDRSLTRAQRLVLDKQSAEKAFPAKPPYSPYAGRNFPTRPFFGDTHTHTSFSMDAGAFGARLDPKEAYRFAKGEEVMASSGQRAKLSRPLDFLVVTDHSDGMGFFPLLIGGDQALLATPQGRKWYDQINSGQGAEAAVDIVTSFGKGQMPKGFPTPGTASYRNAWLETIKAAEEANQPGRFTAFIGYEWTSNAGGNNLHRNIIWRDNGAKASLIEPYTTLPPLGSPTSRGCFSRPRSLPRCGGVDL